MTRLSKAQSDYLEQRALALVDRTSIERLLLSMDVLVAELEAELYRIKVRGEG